MNNKEENLLDNPFALELFATAVAGFSILNGNVSIAFESARVDRAQGPDAINNVVVGRVVMPIGGAQRLAVQLFNYLEAHGHALPKKAALEVQ
jgi:hypothetical protein